MNTLGLDSHFEETSSNSRRGLGMHMPAAQETRRRKGWPERSQHVLV